MPLASRPGPRSTAGGVEVMVDMDEKELAAILSELAHMPDKMHKAEMTAVRKTTKTGATKIKQFLGKGKSGVIKINLPSKKIAARIKTKSPGSQPIGIIKLSNRGYPLHNYGGLPKNPPNQRGVKVAKRKGRASWKVYADGNRVQGRNHFVQRDKRGEVHIMVRTPGGRGGRHAVAPDDYRIKYGPGVVSAMREKGGENKLLLDLGDTLRKNLMSQVDRFLERSKKDR